MESGLRVQLTGHETAGLFHCTTWEAAQSMIGDSAPGIIPGGLGTSGKDNLDHLRDHHGRVRVRSRS